MTYKLLIVDDSEDDRMLLKRSLGKILSCEVVASLPDGQAAIDYLQGINGYEDRQRFPVPDVMLLDFKMPRASGLDVLAWLKEQSFTDLRVIIASNSFKEGDIEKSLQLGARYCFVKGESSEDARVIEGFLRNSGEEADSH